MRSPWEGVLEADHIFGGSHADRIGSRVLHTPRVPPYAKTAVPRQLTGGILSWLTLFRYPAYKERLFL
jgi:hypothetical protein